MMWTYFLGFYFLVLFSTQNVLSMLPIEFKDITYIQTNDIAWFPPYSKKQLYTSIHLDKLRPIKTKQVDILGTITLVEDSVTHIKYITKICGRSFYRVFLMEKNVIQRIGIDDFWVTFICAYNFTYSTPNFPYIPEVSLQTGGGILMQLLGYDLFDLWQDAYNGNEKLPLEVLEWIAAEGLVAIDRLHRKGKIAHLDIKPDNLLVGADGHIRIIDFGFSRPFQNGSFEGTLSSPFVHGTAGYRQGGETPLTSFSANHDYYSLGMTLAYFLFDCEDLEHWQSKVDDILSKFSGYRFIRRNIYETKNPRKKKILRYKGIYQFIIEATTRNHDPSQTFTDLKKTLSSVAKRYPLKDERDWNKILTRTNRVPRYITEFKKAVNPSRWQKYKLPALDVNEISSDPRTPLSRGRAVRKSGKRSQRSKSEPPGFSNIKINQTRKTRAYSYPMTQLELDLVDLD